MKTRKILLPIILTSLSLTSCGGPHGNRAMLRNGDVLMSNKDNFSWEDAKIEANFEQISHLIESKESFIFLLSDRNCAACSNLKSYLTPYIKDNNYFLMVVENNASTYSKLSKQYPNLFIQPTNGILYVPLAQVITNGDKSDMIPDSKLNVKLSFESLVNDMFYETNIYTFRKFKNIQSYLQKYLDATIFYYDRGNENARKIYIEQVKSYAEKSKSNVLIADLDIFNSEDKVSIIKEHHLPNEFDLYAKRFENGLSVAECNFALDANENSRQFINNYLK